MTDSKDDIGRRRVRLRSAIAVAIALVAALAAPCGAEAYQSVNKYEKSRKNNNSSSA